MFRAASTLVWTASLLNPLIAAPPARDDVPRLTVRVYGFPGLSRWVLAAAEAEAARLLRNVPVELDWLNCADPRACSGHEAPGDLTVRVVEKAPPGATGSAMGMAAWSGNQGGAFIFHNRALAFRTHSKLLHHILGRVMAHEIMHLLLPEDPHSDLGLMRGQWTADDLRFDSSACSEPTVRSMREVQNSAFRRAPSAGARASVGGDGRAAGRRGLAPGGVTSPD